jgi:hypothetical protein
MPNEINNKKRSILGAIGRIFNWSETATPTSPPSTPLPPINLQPVQSTQQNDAFINSRIDDIFHPNSPAVQANSGMLSPVIDVSSSAHPAQPQALAIQNRLSGVTRFSTPPPRFTTRQGIGVPSPIEEDMVRVSWYSADWSKRQSIYQNVDDVLANCKEAEQARERFLDGVFNQGCDYKVIPFKASPDSPDDREAIMMAGRANELWQDFERLRTLKIKRQLFGGRVDYGFVPQEIAFDEYGRATEIQVLPPFGMEILLYRGRFIDNQEICYKQHDSLMPAEVYAQWPELGIVWVVNQRYNWQPYGIPALLAAFGHANGLIRGTAILPDAREAAQTETYANFTDAAGNSVHPSTLDDFSDTSRAARKERNELIKPTDIMIANGAREVKKLFGDSEFLNKLDDLKMNGAVVCAVYGDNYNNLYNPHINNRSVMEKIEENQFYYWFNQGKCFTDEVDNPSFKQVIAAGNWGYARQLERNNAQPALYVNPKKVTLVANWKARRPPKILKDEFDSAVKARLVGAQSGQQFISAKSVTEIACRAFDLDEIEEQKRLDDEKLQAKQDAADKAKLDAANLALNPPAANPSLNVKPADKAGAQLDSNQVN